MIPRPLAVAAALGAGMFALSAISYAAWIRAAVNLDGDTAGEEWATLMGINPHGYPAAYATQSDAAGKWLETFGGTR